MSNPYRDEFIALYTANIARDGAQKLLAWLDTTDFYTAPASTKFHCACTSGLVMHSRQRLQGAARAVLHRGRQRGELRDLRPCCTDVCKSQYYKTSTRNVKNEETGQWEKKPFYMVEDAFPVRTRGEIRLPDRAVHAPEAAAEAMAIRWHMGGF